MNKVQFQRELSMAEFHEQYGSTDSPSFSTRSLPEHMPLHCVLEVRLRRPVQTGQ